MIKYILLGIIQGLTEFLPVSSSGHLVIMQKILGINREVVALGIVLHLGTLVALIIFFFQDILKVLRNLRMLGLIIIVTVITGIFGIIGKDFFEKLFSTPRLVAGALIFTGVILIFTRKFMSAKRNILNIKDAIILGFSQGIAIIPGISRSGITVSGLLFRGVERETAFRFSFLASIPAILGATLLEAKNISFACALDFKNFFIGFIFSLLTGILSLQIFKIILRQAKLHYFGYYCIIASLITFIFIK